ncbi:MAG: DNA primase [Longispora sp.]|nr:DNA primase [Longispora sp. (in: high G+C Gram-positive bacteria)]
MDNENERTAEIDEFWDKAGVQPVQIALPTGVGYTLRAYRMAETLPQQGEDIDVDEDVDDADTGDDLVTRIEGTDDPLRGLVRHDNRAENIDDDELDELDDEDTDEPPAEDFEDKPTGAMTPEGEVPVFLSRRNKLLLFRTAEGLVSFVSSGTPNGLSFLKEWNSIATNLEPSHIAPHEDDSYELDLLVENLRGGHDTWDPDLIISAGELARDLGYALPIKDVLAALAPSSPLDELDEALRKSVDGGMGAMFARRRAKKVGAEQAALAWRTIIGKISAATNWRD